MILKKFIPISIVMILFSINIQSKNAIYYNKSGWEYLKKDDYYNAIFNFKNALRQNGNYKNSLIGLGKAYTGIEVYSEASQLFERALKIDNKSIDALIGSGIIFTKLGNYRLALNFFKKAIKISPKNIDAKYGVAYLYYRMDKKIWAKRNIQAILKINPYHFHSLLLYADIKNYEKRMDIALEYINKAIDSRSDSPEGYIKQGEIYLKNFLKNKNSNYLLESINSLKNATLIQSDNFKANKLLGEISMIKADIGFLQEEPDLYNEAIKFFKISAGKQNNNNILYNLSLAYDLSGNKNLAFNKLLITFKKDPYDSITTSKLEDFLVFNKYKAAHPARIMLSEECYETALIKIKKQLPDQVINYLRRTLYLNPLNHNAREKLISYYKTFGYYRFYINELKYLAKTGNNKYKEQLNLAIIKRRNRLYYKENYFTEIPPRDLPGILVLNFNSENNYHFDGGSVLADRLTFTLKQFGRMNTFGLKDRKKIAKIIKIDKNPEWTNFNKISTLIRSGEIPQVNFLIFGNYKEMGNRITIDLKILDYNKGIIINEFSISESGKEAIPYLSLRAANKIYNSIPFKGRILKLKDDGIIINLGVFDGISKNKKIYIEKYITKKDNTIIKNKMIFKITDADTMISYAKPVKKSDIDKINPGDKVFPLKQRRAKLIK